MLARGVALLVWAAVAALAAYWGSRLLARPSPVPPQARLATSSPPQGDLTRLLGAAPVVAVPAAAAAPPPADARFKLLGVVAARGNARAGGVALIAVDGKPARAFKVGAAIDGDQVLQSVAPREVTIGPRGGVATVSLQLAALPAAVPTTLPPALSGVPAPAAAPGRIVFPGVNAPGAGLPGPAASPQPRATTPALPSAFQRPMTAPLPGAPTMPSAAPAPTFPMPPAPAGAVPASPFRLPGDAAARQ